MNLAALILTAALQLIPAPVEWTPAEGNVREGAKVCWTKTGRPFRDLEPWQREEAYRITLTPRRIRVEYASPAGRRRAAASLQQLGGQVPCGELFDYPRFRHRGLMIDESRSFKGIPFLKKQIDAMALLKLNVLHLHLTDSAGWRIEIKSRPQLTAKTAYRIGWDYFAWEAGKYRFTTADDPDGSGGYYTRDELRELVAYAAERHITVIPEIEMPGHSMEVGYAYPDVLCTTPDGRVCTGAWDLCPGSEATFALLEDVLGEVMDIFPGPYIHLGGDEATMKTWAQCPKCRSRMEAEGLGEVKELQGYLMRRVASFVHGRGRRIIGWDEILDTGVPQEAVVQSWRGTAGGERASRMGHDVILSPSSHCYLNYYQDLIRKEPKATGTLTSLHWCYDYEPVGEGMDAARVLGLQGNLWCEYIPTPAHAEYMLYPRLFAIAETGWSPSGKKDYEDFRERARRLLGALKQKGYEGFDMDGESELARSPWNNFPDYEKHRHDDTSLH